jgi:carbon storage regulator CsrA
MKSGFLLLERYEGGIINIGDDIEIKIVEIKTGFNGQRRAVKIAIKAPKDLQIWRNEIYKRIKNNDLGEQQGNPYPKLTEAIRSGRQLKEDE